MFSILRLYHHTFRSNFHANKTGQSSSKMFLIECLETKPTANQNKGQHQNEPIRTGRKRTKTESSAGKRGWQDFWTNREAKESRTKGILI